MEKSGHSETQLRTKPSSIEKGKGVYGIMKMCWQSVSYCDKLLNTEFTWNKNCLSQTDTASSVPCLIDNDMVRVNQ